ncbi:prephenate dehydrogenase [Maritimibacter alkaliphilus]|uniref:prephenate dehydrogenase n=1 Tax=Maritimibacter alkaliphilus TaxID=404236 RepID=UPI001C96B657|nr:prephenate dehydrogenase [Maritimibacter alkaliphilus]MBY6091444.1 prephenate dehydrogenase [Maritimibacter alkaliphilus]
MPATPSLSLFGFGAFGQLLARHLAPDFPLTICDPCPTAQQQARALGLHCVPPQEAACADILILALPLSRIAPLLREIAPDLRPGQMVLDVCSVKEEPVRVMQALLPEGVEILGTHPMFGPASAAGGLHGAQVVLCPVRGRGWRRLGAYLRARHGLKVLRASAEEHDTQAALSQGLTHLLGHVLADMGPAPRIRTRSFEMMMEALEMVAGDAPEVYEAVTRANRHVAPLRARLVAALAAEGRAGEGGR